MSIHPSSADLATQPAPPEAAAIDENTLHYRRVLRRLVDIGDEFAELLRAETNRLVHIQTEAAKHYPDPQMAPAPSLPPDIIDAYERITRSMRRSIMLDEKLARPKKATPAQHRIAARKEIIRDVEDAIHCHATPGEQEKLHAEFLERLDSPDVEYDITSRPIPEIVQNICRDLGVSGVYDTRPGKRRTPHDIAVLHARAAARPRHPPPAPKPTATPPSRPP